MLQRILLLPLLSPLLAVLLVAAINPKPAVSVRLLSQGSDPAGGSFDAHWPTGPAPATDHCAALREQFKGRSANPPARP